MQAREISSFFLVKPAGMWYTLQYHTARGSDLMDFVYGLLCAIGGYLIGSISVSILLSRLAFGSDVRTQGSGNAGAANVARVLGFGAGALTFLGDFAKGVLAIWLGGLLMGSLGACIAGIACLLGHCFPVYFRFRGGKAVSTGAAVALMLDWRLLLIAVAAFALAALLFRTASVSSMTAAVAVAVCAPFFTHDAALLTLSTFAALLVLVMHRANIRRLLDGSEPKFHFGHRK